MKFFRATPILLFMLGIMLFMPHFTRQASADDGGTWAEQTILAYIEAQGLDSKSIADSLDISVKTVSYHITNLLSKLNVSSRQEATIWALKHLSDNLE